MFFYQNCSLRVALNWTIYQKMWKMSVFRVLNKIINLSTVSVKKSTIYDLLFLSGIYSCKNINKYPSEMKNYHQSSFFHIRVVFPSRTYFNGKPKMLTCHQISQEILFHLIMLWERIKGSAHPPVLALSWRRVLSYRNQYIDLGSKSMDWFLYAIVLRHERVNRVRAILTSET